MRNKNVLLFIIGLLILSGCTTTPDKFYSAYREKIREKGKMSLSADMMLHEDTKGKYDILNVRKNERIAKIIIDIIRCDLESKNYKIGEVPYYSYGFVATHDQKLKIVTEPSIDNGKVNRTPYRSGDGRFTALQEDKIIILPGTFLSKFLNKSSFFGVLA